VRGVNNVKQTDIHIAEPIVPEPSAFEIEMATEKLKRHKSPGIDQIQAKLIIEENKKIRSEIHNLINSIWKK
jgi:hypothetical protein